MPEGELDTKHDPMMTNESDDIVSESTDKITANQNAPNKLLDAANSGYDEIEVAHQEMEQPWPKLIRSHGAFDDEQYAGTDAGDRRVSERVSEPSIECLGKPN